MNIRTVTIWTTGLALSITSLVALLLAYHTSWYGASLGRFMWVFCVYGLYLGFQLAVSLVIACNLKHTFPLFVIIFSTIIYGIMFGFGYGFMDSEFGDLALIVSVFYALCVMIPAWLLACSVEILCRKTESKKTSEP